jgi:DNA helicase HerA-like ATPase
MSDPIRIAKGETDLYLLPQMANRHGLIAGATGTGKTISLQVLAEGLSGIGVSVFMADVKGDLSGISQPGKDNPKIQERVQILKIQNFSFQGYPVIYWDVFGEQGHPIRATISEMGPLLLARLFDLNDTQSAVLSLVFKIADDNGLLLLDLKDLQAMLQYVGNNAAQYQTTYGNISAASIGAVQRELMTLDQQGGEKFFGEPALNLEDMIRTDSKGRGMINILAADKLMLTPKTYATFLLWLLSELFERLPEVGDMEKPKMVFFFDEAHLLFDDAPKALLEKIEQVVRLIRSKGVGVYFVSQNPLDIPEMVLGQLSNRVQHALRAFTPLDQKAVKSAAQTFRTNPNLDVAKAITELSVGEALVSLLDEKGMPGIVQRAFMLPPTSQIGPVAPEIRQQIIKSSPVYGHYEQLVDRESAYEKLQGRTTTAPGAAKGSQNQLQGAPLAKPSGNRKSSTPEPTVLNQALKVVNSPVGRQIERALVRGLMGSLLGTSSKR